MWRPRTFAFSTSHFAMRLQVEFYSSMQDAKNVQLCARTIHPSIYGSALFIQTKTQTERENASSVKPPHIGDVQASVVVQMIAVLPEQIWSLSTDFLHLKLHAAC
ncbi:hypothetical protein AVEN_9907-1 [Araneus ventricosus]|uniref:Uncharacterized protein n=1 Tax=Araneus ventricosus TaxID=182803 RepID=A0A4Y2T661_ARAVE|nr:hypothetical protein AVEN_9907-1 [Araneus ventricosus]